MMQIRNTCSALWRKQNTHQICEALNGADQEDC
jgi:hypothetical protein